MNGSHPGRRARRAGGLALVVALVVPIAGAPNRDPLVEGFRNPPAEARTRCYWWWLNGNTDEATITRDLEEMNAKGYGGAILVDADGSGQQGNRETKAGPMFGTDAWRTLFLHALHEAARLKLEISLNLGSGWNLGGPDVTPEQGAKLLTWSRTAASGPAEVKVELPRPAAAPTGFYRDIAVLAYPLRHGATLPGEPRPIRQLNVKSAAAELGMSTPLTAPLLEDYPAAEGEADTAIAEVLDLTSHMTPDGRFSWSAPAGTWEILRVGYTASGAKVSTSSNGWQGLAIDYLDRSVFDDYCRRNITPLLEAARPYLGTSLKYLVTDSWELGGVNWTPRFRQEFQTRRGYDLLPYLPVVAGRIVGSRQISGRFLNDLRRTVGDLIIDGHYRPFAELASRYGLGIHPESGGPHGAPLDALETLGISAYPQTEYWAPSATHRTTDPERFFLKEASSAAHTYGKTLVAAEGMTSIGPQWEETPASLQPAFDQAITEGMNRLFWHTFTSSPREMGLPGQEYFAGTHLNPNVTWWQQAGAFLAYLNRVQFLMQQGRPVADVLYYYGDHVPNFVQLKAADPAKVLPGYDYDVADEFVLSHRLAARSGEVFLPDGVTYRLLVLPDRVSISPAAIRAVRQLVSSGAAVWDRGRRPLPAWAAMKRCAPSPPKCGAIAAAMASPNTASARGSSTAVNPHARFSSNYQPFPTSKARGSTTSIAAPTLRKSTLSAILNPLPRPSMSLSGSPAKCPKPGQPRPAKWNPWSSSQLPMAARASPFAFRLAGARWSCCGMRRTQFPRGQRQTTRKRPERLDIPGPWHVEFTPGWGAPAKIAFPRLVSWTENADPGIRYYSGTASYSTRFQLPDRPEQDRQFFLDLGDVREIARVRLNGQDLGVLWKTPFRVALGAAARPGPNDLEVEVTNLWPNRLIGDAALPPEERRTHTNITKFHAGSPLLPSGLLGPVTVEAVRSR